MEQKDKKEGAPAPRSQNTEWHAIKKVRLTIRTEESEHIENPSASPALSVRQSKVKKSPHLDEPATEKTVGESEEGKTATAESGTGEPAAPFLRKGELRTPAAAPEPKARKSAAPEKPSPAVQEETSAALPQKPEKAPAQENGNLQTAKAPEDAPVQEAVSDKETVLQDTAVLKETPSGKAVSSQETPPGEAVSSQETPSGEAVSSQETPPGEAVSSQETPPGEAVSSQETPSEEALSPEETPSEEAVSSEETPENPPEEETVFSFPHYGDDTVTAPEAADRTGEEPIDLTGTSENAGAKTSDAPAREPGETPAAKGAEDENAPILPKVYFPDRPRLADTLFDFFEILIFTLVAILILTSFCFRHSIVDGTSMEGTLHDGEQLIISHLFYTPKRGDIIVFEDFEAADRVHSSTLRKPLVKRVIATAGETVTITAQGQVFVDGVLLTEDYVTIDVPYYVYEPLEYTVAEGYVFVMGDHRNASTDSRAFGAVREDAILGRVLFRFAPFDKFGTVE